MFNIEYQQNQSEIPSRSGKSPKVFSLSVYASMLWVIIGSDNGLSPVRRQAITWSNDDLLSGNPWEQTVVKFELKEK